MEAKAVAKGVEDVKNVEVSIVTANIDENVENEPALIDDVALAGKLKNVELLDNVIDALDTTKTCVVSAEVGCHGSEDVEHAAPADTIVDEIKVATEIVDALNAIGGYINIAEPATDNQIARPNLLDELLQLDDVIGAIENIEPFDCEICLDTIEPKNGIVLRECLHSFCKVCISESVAHDFNVTAKCPSPDCDFHLQEREIRAIVSENIYHHYMLKGVRAAQSTIRGAVLCSLPDCDGWYICDDTINQFQCPTCQQPNCIPCQAIHVGRNCKEYQEDFAFGHPNGLMGACRRSEASMKAMVAAGEAMRCPKCQIYIMKREGCDWLLCTMCRMEICWATKGPRWGPNGNGDTSAGCRCGVNGVKCHPTCGYCHV